MVTSFGFPGTTRCDCVPEGETRGTRGSATAGAGIGEPRLVSLVPALAETAVARGRFTAPFPRYRFVIYGK